MIINNEKKEEAIRLYREEHITPKELSAKFGVSVPTIYVWLRSAKTEVREEDKKDEEEIKQIVKDYEDVHPLYKPFEVIRKQREEIESLKKEVQLYKDLLFKLNTLIDQQNGNK